VAKTTLTDLIDATWKQTEHLSDTFDTRFDEFLAGMQQDRLKQAQDAAEARKEMSNQLSGGLGAAGAAAPDVEFGDPVVPSKESGMILAVGKAFGTAGLGIAAAAAGIGYLVSQVNDIGPSMSRLAKGFEDLENTEVSGEQFTRLGNAIADLVSGAGIGGALGLRILSGTAFEDLAKGIKTLNEVEIDPSNLARVGEGLDALLAPLNLFDMGEAGVLQAVDDNLKDLAAGVDALAKAEIPEVSKMEEIGKGINKMLEPISASDLGEALVFQAIDDNLETLAAGLNALNTVDADKFYNNAPKLGEGIDKLLDGVDDLLGTTGLQAIDDNLIPLANGLDRLNAVDDVRFMHVAKFIGPAFERLLDGTDDLAGAVGLQAIDDNLKPLSDAIKYMTNVIDEDVMTRFSNLASFIGPAFQKILGGTDDLLGATGLQAIDDNLIPLADGVKYMSDVGGDVNLENVGKIVDAVNELDRMKDVPGAKVNRLAQMLRAVAPIQSQRADNIAANTETAGTGGNVTIVNAPTNSQTTNTSVSQRGSSPLPPPTTSNGGRADAYSAA